MMQSARAFNFAFTLLHRGLISPPSLEVELLSVARISHTGGKLTKETSRCVIAPHLNVIFSYLNFMLLSRS